MGQYVKTSDVAGGRIRAVCSRCESVAYLEVAPGSRRRIHRCKCGKSATYKINYRRERRETTYGPAKVVLKDSREQKVRLNDTSIDGVSFFIQSEHAMGMRRGQELGIKFRAGSGSAIQRKICIKNISKNRVGAQFVRAMAAW